MYFNVCVYFINILKYFFLTLGKYKKTIFIINCINCIISVILHIVFFNLWAFHFLVFTIFIKKNFCFLWRWIPIVDDSQSLDSSFCSTRNTDKTTTERNARRKQVRKISFPINDKESRSSSQRALFPICSYPLRRWLKLPAKHSRSPKTRWSCPLTTSFFSRSVVITRLPAAAPRLVIKVPPTPLLSILRKYDLRNSIRQRQLLRAACTSRTRKRANEWRTRVI